MDEAKRQPSSFLPTIASTYGAVEEYLEYLAASSGGLPAAPSVPLRPIDALLITLMAAYQSGRPHVIDLASSATCGASTVLCRTISAVRSVAVLRGLPDVWRFPLNSYLRDLDRPLAPMSEVQDDLEALRVLTEPHAPLLVLTALGVAGAEIAADVERWLECRPRAVVLVLGVGETGTCPGLAALTASFAGSPRRLALLRERAPALAGSGLAAVGHRAQAEFEEALIRIGLLFTDHFQYLDLVKRACLSALERSREDDIMQTMRHGGPGQHTGNSELTESYSISTLWQALEDRNQEFLEMRNSLTVQMAIRLSRLLRMLAPAGSPQRWAAVKARAGVRRLVRGRAAAAAAKLR